MSRPRTPKNQALPPYVYLRREYYQYRARLDGGQYGSYIKLCPADAKISEVWQRYEEITKPGQPKKNPPLDDRKIPEQSAACRPIAAYKKILRTQCRHHHQHRQ